MADCPRRPPHRRVQGAEARQLTQNVDAHAPRGANEHGRNHASPPEKKLFTPSRKVFWRGECLLPSCLSDSSNSRSSARCSLERCTGVSTTTRRTGRRAWARARLHAFFLEPEHAARLRFGRNLEHDLAIERGHLDTATERRGREADGHLAAQMYAIALEDGVLSHAHLDIQISCRAAIAAGLAFTDEPYAIARIDPGGIFTDSFLARITRP